MENADRFLIERFFNFRQYGIIKSSDIAIKNFNFVFFCQLKTELLLAYTWRNN